VVDAFDAIVHPRPYRAARSIEAALTELHNERGRQFDPALVEVFVRIVEADLRLADEGLTAAAFRTLNAGVPA
jgi:HD-GYP domain-containing protein (c-di-GMP phosphodiesterase class II)